MGIMIGSAVIGIIVYSFAAVSYAYSTFLPRTEAEARREGRDKAEATIIKQLDNLNDKFDSLDKYLRETRR